MPSASSGMPAGDQQGREWWLVSLCLMGLTAAACWWHWTWHLDQAVYDAAQSTWQRQPAPDIVIVSIDDASLQAIGRWPWKRSIHARVLQQIQAASPKSVMLDLLLSEPDADPQQDALLANAMRQLDKVILPVSHALDGTGQGHELRPIPLYQDAAHLAHADAAIDVDGTLRRAYLWAGTRAHRYPHPALAMLQTAGEWPEDIPTSAGQNTLRPAPTVCKWHTMQASRNSWWTRLTCPTHRPPCHSRRGTTTGASPPRPLARTKGPGVTPSCC